MRSFRGIWIAVAALAILPAGCDRGELEELRSQVATLEGRAEVARAEADSALARLLRVQAERDSLARLAAEPARLPPGEVALEDRDPFACYTVQGIRLCPFSPDG